MLRLSALNMPNHVPDDAAAGQSIDLRNLLHTFFYAVFTEVLQPGVDRFEDVGDGLLFAYRDQLDFRRISICFGAGVGDAVLDTLEIITNAHSEITTPKRPVLPASARCE